MQQITIKNQFLKLQVLDYGAVIQHLTLLNGKFGPTELVVSYEDPEHYLNDTMSLGACVGRFAGRISGRGFNLDGEFYKLYEEEGIHLHGGKNGFDSRFWKVVKVVEGSQPYIRLEYRSDHLEEGYPGELRCQVQYTLVKNSLEVLFTATTDRPTIVNLTNHSYFRLDDENDISHYELQLTSNHYLETDENLIPTGKFLETKGSTLDFSSSRPIGDLQLDTPFSVDHGAVEFANISSAISGIRMSVVTNQPAVVIYRPKQFGALCFETQNYPDAPNQPEFPSAVLRPGDIYRNRSLFKFDLI